MTQIKYVCIILLMCSIPLISSAQEPAKKDSTKKGTVSSIITTLETHNAVLSTNMVELLVKGPNVMYEQVINGNHGITGKLVYDLAPSVKLVYLESTYRWYLWHPNDDKPLTGLYGGPFLKMTQQTGGEKKFTFGLGATAGFKWIWIKHFELEPAVVLSYPFGFDLHLSFGYAF